MNSTALRKAANITLDPNSIAEAKQLGINISKACEQGLNAEIIRTKQERWLADNKDALTACNKWSDENGLPLSDHRRF